MTAATQRRPRRSLYVGLILAAAVGGAAYILFRPHFDLAASSAASADPRPVPVTTGVVEIQDFPIYRIGVGTVQAYNTVTVRVRVDGEMQTIAFREGQDVPAIALRRLIRARRRLSCIRRRLIRQGMRPLLANAELDLERYSSLAAKEFASRQSVDTQKALVAQYQAAIQRDEAAIDNAGVSLGYTTITSPINGRTGVRLVDLGNIVHASDSTGLVVVTQLDPIFVIFTLPQDNLPEITEAMRQGALTSRMTRITVSSLARGASRSSTTRSTRATAHFD